MPMTLSLFRKVPLSSDEICIIASIKILYLLSVLQPRNDLEPLMDTLNEYKGILGQFPDVLKVHEVRIYEP